MKYPYLKFYFRDWQANTELQSCSIAARGVWIELMCIMAQSERFGYLERNGAAMTLDTLARLVRVESTALASMLAELEAAGVFSRDPDTQAIYSRRMVRDVEFTQTRADCGKLGGNPSLKNPISNTNTNTHIHSHTYLNHEVKVKDKVDLKVELKQKEKTFKQWTADDLTASVKAANTDNLLTASEAADFVGYWTEKTASGRFRFQLQQTWDTRRRMCTAVRVVYEKQRISNQPKDSFGRPADKTSFAPDLGKEERERDEYQRRLAKTMNDVRPGTAVVK